MRTGPHGLDYAQPACWAMLDAQRRDAEAFDAMNDWLRPFGLEYHTRLGACKAGEAQRAMRAFERVLDSLYDVQSAYLRARCTYQAALARFDADPDARQYARAEQQIRALAAAMRRAKRERKAAIAAAQATLDAVAAEVTPAEQPAAELQYAPDPWLAAREALPSTWVVRDESRE